MVKLKSLLRTFSWRSLSSRSPSRLLNANWIVWNAYFKNLPISCVFRSHNTVLFLPQVLGDRIPHLSPSPFFFPVFYFLFGIFVINLCYIIREISLFPPVYYPVPATFNINIRGFNSRNIRVRIPWSVLYYRYCTSDPRCMSVLLTSF